MMMFSNRIHGRGDFHLHLGAIVFLTACLGGFAAMNAAGQISDESGFAGWFFPRCAEKQIRRLQPE